jgi:hypothetical protein
MKEHVIPPKEELSKISIYSPLITTKVCKMRNIKRNKRKMVRIIGTVEISLELPWRLNSTGLSLLARIIRLK